MQPFLEEVPASTLTTIRIQDSAAALAVMGLGQYQVCFSVTGTSWYNTGIALTVQNVLVSLSVASIRGPQVGVPRLCISNSPSCLALRFRGSSGTTPDKIHADFRKWDEQQQLAFLRTHTPTFFKVDLDYLVGRGNVRAGTQFSCFTGTKVQILTHHKSCSWRSTAGPASCFSL
jgi:hypothetical protein